MPQRSSHSERDDGRGHRPERSSLRLGAGGPACYPDRRLDAAVGHDPDATTAYWIGRVTEDVSAVLVTMSDGTREDLKLYGDPGRHGARVAALACPRHLDIHRVDLLDSCGHPLPDERS